MGRLAMVIGFYVLLTLILVALGYFVVPRVVKLGKNIGGFLGAVLGIVISIALWFLIGKRMVSKRLANKAAEAFKIT